MRYLAFAAIIALPCCVAVTCSVSIAQSSATHKWGDLIDAIARLTWAEKNCSGRASDGVRALRLYLRKHANPEFEEAIIKDLTDTREIIEDARKVVSETEAIQSTCAGVYLVYGPRGGTLPGLWMDNRAPSAGASTRPQKPKTFLPRFGEFVRALALIDHLKSQCKGTPSALASEFTRAFIAGGGEIQFKKLYEEDNPLPDWMQGDVEGRCEALKTDYGPDSNEWPTLWYGFRSAPDRVK